jgi:hypothetical protein
MNSTAIWVGLALVAVMVAAIAYMCAVVQIPDDRNHPPSEPPSEPNDDFPNKTPME